MHINFKSIFAFIPNTYTAICRECERKQSLFTRAFLPHLTSLTRFPQSPHAVSKVFFTNQITLFTETIQVHHSHWSLWHYFMCLRHGIFISPKSTFILNVVCRYRCMLSVILLCLLKKDSAAAQREWAGLNVNVTKLNPSRTRYDECMHQDIGFLSGEEVFAAQFPATSNHLPPISPLFYFQFMFSYTSPQITIFLILNCESSYPFCIPLIARACVLGPSCRRIY